MDIKTTSERYLVRTPQYRNSGTSDSGQDPTGVYLSPELVPQSPYQLELKWVTRATPPGLIHTPEKQPFDQIIFLIGSQPEHPQTLGGEVEFKLGDQTLQTATTTGIFVPRDLPCGPRIVKSLSRPHLQMTLKLGENQAPEIPYSANQGFQDLQRRGVDYEEYVVRSPLREAGAEFLRGRTAPTLTYMSGNQVPGVKCYIEFGWTFDMPLSSRAGSGMPEMQHSHFDEIVLHIGGDWRKPNELGGLIEFYVDGQPLRFDTSTALYVPRGLKHGPLACLEYRQPHIVMAIMAGIGSLREGWNSDIKPLTPA